MRFQTPKCLDCGQPAASIIETVEVRSYPQQSDGQFYFERAMNDVNWETQAPLQESESGDAFVHLGCSGCGSYWRSKTTELDVGFPKT